MKKRYTKKFWYAAVPALGVLFISAGVASAHGFGRGAGTLAPEEFAARHTEMFERQASMLGITVDQVKQAWASGKTFMELAQERGISEEALRAKMQEARLAEMKTNLQALVTKGVITQTQADQRLQFMETRQGEGKRFGMGRGMRFEKSQ